MSTDAHNLATEERWLRHSYRMVEAKPVHVSTYALPFSVLPPAGALLFPRGDFGEVVRDALADAAIAPFIVLSTAAVQQLCAGGRNKGRRTKVYHKRKVIMRTSG